jgi:hypothetical protein
MSCRYVTVYLSYSWIIAWWKTLGFYGSLLRCVLAFLAMASCCARPVCQCFRDLSFLQLEVKGINNYVVPDGRTMYIIKCLFTFLRMSADSCTVLKYVENRWITCNRGRLKVWSNSFWILWDMSILNVSSLLLYFSIFILTTVLNLPCLASICLLITSSLIFLSPYTSQCHTTYYFSLQSFQSSSVENYF